MAAAPSSSTPDRPTPSDAAALLRGAGHAAIDRPQDRRAHARYLAGIGVLLGLWAGVAWATADARWSGLITLGLQVAYLVGLITLVARRERRARTVPRGTRLAALWGAAGTGTLFLAVTLPLLDRGNGGLPAAAGLAVLVAAPALVAAAHVARTPR
jgi:hypothetical protein